MKSKFSKWITYNLNTFCDIISHLTSKYRPDSFRTFEISGPDFGEH
jgi:hypothetical protein